MTFPLSSIKLPSESSLQTDIHNRYETRVVGRRPTAHVFDDVRTTVQSDVNNSYDTCNLDVSRNCSQSTERSKILPVH